MLERAKTTTWTNLCEDEPFVSGRMDEAIVLREAFLDAIRHDESSNDTAAFESVYNARVESRVRAA